MNEKPDLYCELLAAMIIIFFVVFAGAAILYALIMTIIS